MYFQLLLSLLLAYATTAQRTPLIADLETILNNNTTLQGHALKMFQDTGFANYTINDVYDWFQNFSIVLPSPSKMPGDVFLSIMSRTDAGKVFFYAPVIIQWLKKLNTERGVLLWSANSTSIIPEWLVHPPVNISEYFIPEEGFTSFNSFFVRRVKPWLRPIDSPKDNAIVVNPSDGEVIFIYSNVEKKTTFSIKESVLSVSSLIGSENTQPFIGGKSVQIFLTGHNYHRWHSPVAGIVKKIYKLGDIYYDDYYADFIYTFHRGIVLIETEDVGMVGIVAVGMYTVGSVNFTVSEGLYISKGFELGYFANGGSTIVALFGPQANVDITLKVNDTIIQGARLGVAHPNKDLTTMTFDKWAVYVVVIVVSVVIVALIIALVLVIRQLNFIKKNPRLIV